MSDYPTFMSISWLTGCHKNKIIFNAKNAKMKIDVVMKNYSNIQTLFKIKLKHEFWIMIIIIKLNIQS